MSTIRTVDGRNVGRRGQITRENLLKATAELLAEHGFGDVKVIDVARVAKTSPATYYQYFPTDDGAVLELAQRTAAGVRQALAPFELGDTADTDPVVVDRAAWAFLKVIKAHTPVVRAVDLLHTHHRTFREVRDQIHAPMRDLLAQVSARHCTDLSQPPVRAHVLVNMLAAAACNTTHGSDYLIRRIVTATATDQIS